MTERQIVPRSRKRRRPSVDSVIPVTPAGKKNGKRRTPPSVGRRDGTVIRHADTIPNGRSWELLEGDSGVALSLLPASSVNCVVTSPPYFWQRDYDVEGQIGHEPTIDGYVQALVECFQQVWRVLRDDGVVFLNLGDTYYSAKGKPHG